MNYLLGIDTSTTATKALLIDETGAVIATAASEHPYDTPHPGWTEQHPDLFWEGTVNSIRAVMEKAGATDADVAAIGLTGQMHGMTLLDAHGAVIRPTILWNDQRTAKQCEAITQRVGAERVIKLTGNPVLTGFTAPKIVWVRDHEPDNFRRIAQVLLPKDYVRYKLTGGFFSDVSDASGTSLFDIGQRRWSDEMLRALDIPPAWLPEVTESPVVTSHLSAEAARITGLLAGTPVVAGGGDQAAGALGMGIVRAGAVSLQLGTSGVIFAAADQYQPEAQGRLHAFCHAVPGKWHWMGVMLSAAGSFRWWRDLIADLRLQITDVSQSEIAYDALTALAAQVPAGSEGLFFLPYLTGERTPHPDPNARGAFVGLGVHHTHAHLTRAVLEGINYGLRDSLALMRGLGLRPTQVRASGGGLQSSLWRQMLADVFATEIATVTSTEGAAYGAALLAGVGAGVWPSVEAACDVTVRVTSTTTPGPDSATYDRFYPHYRALYPALKDQFAAMASLNE
ncbi:MAG: xylulokinase [Anaerolineales bacterium]